MTRTTYIKPNSHAQQVAQESQSIVTRTLQFYGISFDQWLAIMFECGCRYVESRHCSPHYRSELLTNEARGFWAKWMVGFIEDDAVMLAQPDLFPDNYEHHKMQLANPFA